ncbi:MAG: IS66 family insertion sequence element accessory protein TnpB [Acidobacteriota bacterium]|nr:IS66 family insertion sequence element accessory protein TnpB [Acidobacteriota bacterium]
MFLPLGRLRFYLYTHPTDMRKGFNGLSGIIISTLKCDPLSGDVYVFINRRKDRIKLLFWDKGGFWIFYKLLEKGTFQRPFSELGKDSVDLSYDELIMILEGIDLSTIKRKTRYHRLVTVA